MVLGQEPERPAAQELLQVSSKTHLVLKAISRNLDDNLDWTNRAGL